VLPELGFGTANVGNLLGVLPDEQAHAVLDAAWEAGIRYFDTAPHYGLGLAERRLGAFLRSKPRGDYVVSTKAGRLLVPDRDWDGESLDLGDAYHVPASTRRQWDFTPDGVRRSLDESLERMGLDDVDLLYLHDPEGSGDATAAIASGAEGLHALKAEGRIAATGLGSMTTRSLELGAEAGLDVLMVAGRLTLADQPALARVVPLCAVTGTRIVAASVFNSGVLATDDPGEDALYQYGSVPPEVLEKVRRIGAVCRSFGVSLPAAALQYPRRFTPVACVVTGTGDPDQLRQNVAHATVTIPEALWDALAQEGLIP